MEMRTNHGNCYGNVNKFAHSMFSFHHFSFEKCNFLIFLLKFCFVRCDSGSQYKLYCTQCAHCAVFQHIYGGMCYHLFDFNCKSIPCATLCQIRFDIYSSHNSSFNSYWLVQFAARFPNTKTKPSFSSEMLIAICRMRNEGRKKQVEKE